MPHVIEKLWPGKSEEQRAKEVAASEWLDKVYQPDIEASAAHLYKKPGYGPEDL